MGYDMRMDTAEPGEAEAVAAAREAFNVACTKRNGFERDTDEYKAAQAEVDDTYLAMDKADRSYFRLNIWGMGAACQAMHALGMLDTETQSPDWPEREAFGVDDATWEAFDWEEPGQDAPEPLRRWWQAQEKALSHHPEKPTGICDFKFGSNDGWHVTPEEIAAALTAYERALEDAVNANGEVPTYEWWGDWIDYLRRAQMHGGFRVH